MSELNDKKGKKPPATDVRSVQFDLFRYFVTNDKTAVSNTVELWENIPKYFLTPKQVDALRTVKGHADPYKWAYSLNGVSHLIKIQPALIEQEEGGYKAFFPGVTEELVEEALKKILTEQNYGIHDHNKRETWVRFTLSLIQKELKNRGRSRNRAQIKQAIEVMGSCILTVYRDEQEVWKGSILQDLVTVGRKEYLADTDAQHVARLPLFISHGINYLEYRQFNYDRLMQCNQQLTRWVYKRLINRFKQANLSNSYHFMFSELKDSGLLQQKRPVDNRNKVILALKELQERSVIIDFNIDERCNGRAISDVKYVLFPSPDFVNEQKAANKRYRDHYHSALGAGVTLVDK